MDNDVKLCEAVRSKKTLEEGSQIILFLTYDGIQGVESILDKKAGKIFTLTNFYNK